MKMTQKLIFLLSIICSTTVPNQLPLTRENTVIACDIDKVLLKLPKSQYPGIAWQSMGLIQSPRDMVDIFKSLLNIYHAYFTKDEHGINGFRDANGNSIDGLTPQLLHVGMKHTESTRFIPSILEIIEPSRQLINDTIKILHYANIPIIFTTNKDHLTYERAVETHGIKLTNLTTKAVVTKQPLSKEILTYAQQPGTPENYRALVKKYESSQETDTIIHAPHQKPAVAYYQCVEKVVGPEKNIIFIDDKAKNIAGFKQLPNSTDTQRIGIHFKNPIQLANELIKLGILSETKDQKFLQKIRKN